MYLKGSKLSMVKRRKRSNPWRLLVLVVLVGGAIYVNQVVVPVTPPLFIPTPTATRSPESFVSDAEALLDEGKMSQAIQAYQEAILADPNNGSNYVTIARLYIYNGDYAKAVENAENALLLNQNNATAHAIRGWALGFQNDFLLAESALNEALAIDPNNAAAYAYLAEVLVLKIQADLGDLGTIDNAIEYSRLAQQISPGSMETHRGRGIVLEQTGNYEEAVAEFEAATAINDNIADLHLALGRNYRSLAQYDLAVEEFNRANALNPSDPMPDIYISRTYITVGEHAKAVQYAQQAIKDSPIDPYMYGTLGTAFYRNEQFQEAADAFKLAIQGGLSEDGQEIEGLPLDYGRISEYYQLYGLSLAKSNNCGEGLLIAQALLQGVPTDEYAVYNAEEVNRICQELSQNPPTATPLVEDGQMETPEPTETTAE